MKFIMENFRNFIELNESANPATIKKIQDAISHAGGESYITGGAVRDSLMPDVPESKDVDFIVTGLPLDKIAQVLSPMGKVNQVGASFGVVIANIDGEDFDIAIPRTGETKTGDGHGDFDVTTDHTAPVEADLERRDFTMNAMAKDSDGNIVDLFGGREDIKNKVIRTVGNPEERFREDPLRMLRALQFAVRFGFTIEPSTAEAIKKLSGSFSTISGERILGEFKKAWTKGKADPTLFIKLLEDLGVGKELFGEDFQPIPVQASSNSPEDKAVVGFISFFIRGGDAKVMKPSNDMVRYLELAKSAVKKIPAFEFIKPEKGDRDKLKLIIDVLKTIDKEAAVMLEKAIDLPLSAKELAIGGGDLARLGLRGAEIGQAQKQIMAAIHDGSLENSPEEIERFLGEN